MIAELLAALALIRQPAPEPQPTIHDVIEALPERDGQSAWEYTGAEEAYTDVWLAASDYWLNDERMGGRSYRVRYSARPAFGQNGFRQVVVRRHQGDWNTHTRSYDGPYVYAQRLTYANADVMEAFGRVYPLEAVVRAFGSRTRIDQDWSRERKEFFPDSGSVIRLIRVRRETLDERTCPALRAALERLNLLETPPVHISGFGPDRRPNAELDDGTIVVTGDGTGFELEIEGQRGFEGQHFEMVFRGNHGSIPGAWIEQFETETVDCWRPDDGADPPS